MESARNNYLIGRGVDMASIAIGIATNVKTRFPALIAVSKQSGTGLSLRCSARVADAVQAAVANANAATTAQSA